MDSEWSFSVIVEDFKDDFFFDIFGGQFTISQPVGFKADFRPLTLDDLNNSFRLIDCCVNTKW
jgi:hypothetical protein